MATSVNTSLPMWLTGGTYDGDAGNDLRNSHITATYLDTGIMSGSTIGVRGGVLGGAGLIVAAASGMNVSVQPGSFVAPNTATPVAGGYSATLAQSATLTVQAADPSNPRIDIIVANVVDNGNSTSFGEVQIITGTAAASPAPPATPANSITLAQIAVAALATSITAGNITDTRPYTTTAGGVLVAAKGSVTGYAGQAAWDKASGSFYHNTNLSGSKQFKVLPFAPAMKARTSAYSYPNGTATVIVSVNVTTDGLTDLKISWHIAAIAPWNGGDAAITHSITVDGRVVEAEVAHVVQDNEASLASGCGGVTYASSVTGGTPGAGVHTVALMGMTDAGSGGFPQLHLLTGLSAPAWIRVEPAVL